MSSHPTFRPIGQNVLIKNAVWIEISIRMALLSFLQEDKGWTKRVDENLPNY